MRKFTEFTVYFPDREDITYQDSANRRYDFEVIDGHLFIREILRLIPDRSDGWKSPRTLRCLPPGQWIDVEVEYK